LNTIKGTRERRKKGKRDENNEIGAMIFIYRTIYANYVQGCSAIFIF